MAGRTAENKKQKRRNYRRLEMSEAVQAEICGLNEALEGSESKISWCIYRRKEQDIVERMKKRNKSGCPCRPGCRNPGGVWRAGRKWNIRGRRALWSGLQSEDDCTSG